MLRTRRYRLGWAIAAAAVFSTAGPASAFYWKGWPGANIPPDRNLVEPPGSFTPTPPTANPTYPPGGPETPPPTPGNKLPPPEPGNKLPPPENVPEPATGVIGLIGLAAVAARWAQRKA
jgi:hypothetical protein